MYTFVVLVLCCIVVISFAIPIEQLDKVVSHNPFDYFTDLDAEDVWFSQTTQDEFANGWIHEPDANVITRLERMSKWHSIMSVNVHLVGLGTDSTQTTRLHVLQPALRRTLEQAGHTFRDLHPLPWSPHLSRSVEYLLRPFDQTFAQGVQSALNIAAQTQFDILLQTLDKSHTRARLTPELLTSNVILRISPSIIDGVISTFLNRRHPDQSQRPHILFLTPELPTVTFEGKQYPVKYIYSHLPSPHPTLDAVLEKANPRCDFSQHAASSSTYHYRIHPQTSSSTDDSSSPSQSSRHGTSISPDSASYLNTPFFWVDLAAEQLTFHNIALQDVSTLELLLPNFHRSQLPNADLPAEHAQFNLRIAALTNHITHHILLAPFIPKAPLLTLTTQVNIYHIADRYTANNLHITEPNYQPNQFASLIAQVQALAPSPAHHIDVTLTPIALSTCTLCLNAINSALRQDPQHELGGPDGKYLDSGTLFDWFGQFKLAQWSILSSSGKTGYFIHHSANAGIKGTSSPPTEQRKYHRIINVFAIEPSMDLQRKHHATLLLDKSSQTMANREKTMIVGLLNTLPVTQACHNNMPAPLQTMVQAAPVPAGQEVDIALTTVQEPQFLLSNPHLALFTSLVSVVYGFGSSKASSFYGGAPLADTLYAFEGSLTPFVNRQQPNIAAADSLPVTILSQDGLHRANVPSVNVLGTQNQAPPRSADLSHFLSLAPSSTLYHIKELYAHQLLADILNAVTTTLNTIRSNNFDFTLLPEEYQTTILVRMNLLEYKLMQARSLLSGSGTTISSRPWVDQSAEKDIIALWREQQQQQHDGNNEDQTQLNTMKQSMRIPTVSAPWFTLYDHIYAYLFSARHDIGWLLMTMQESVKKLEPVTLCIEDVYQHQHTVHGASDFLQHMMSSLTDALGVTTPQSPDSMTNGPQGYNIDSKVNEYIISQEHNSYVTLGVDIVIIIVIGCMFLLCCVLGRKRITVDHDNDDFVSHGNARKVSKVDTQRASTFERQNMISQPRINNPPSNPAADNDWMF